MYKIDFLKAVVKACNGVDEIDVYDVNASIDLSIKSIEQVRSIRSAFHGFFDDYYDNNYYKENVQELQSIFEKIDGIFNNKKLLENKGSPIFQFMYGEYSKEEIDRKFLSNIVEILTGKKASEDELIQFTKEFYATGDTLIDIHNQVLQNLFVELGSELERLYTAVKWE